MGVKGLSGQKFLEREMKTFYYDKAGGGGRGLNLVYMDV